MADKGMNWVKAEYDWDNIKTRKIETCRRISNFQKKMALKLKNSIKVTKN